MTALSRHSFLEVLDDSVHREVTGTVNRSSDNGDFCLDACFEEISLSHEPNSVGSIRSVKIYSDKVEVLSFFCYPKPEYGLPLFACEFVNLNNKRLIVALDIPMHNELKSTQNIHCLTTSLIREFKHVSGQSTLPQWYEECASPAAVFYKSDDIETFRKLINQSVSAWCSYVKLCLLNCTTHKISSGREIQKNDAFIENYKHHHSVNSPGLPLMNASFGEHWTDMFLNGQFFA